MRWQQYHWAQARRPLAERSQPALSSQAMSEGEAEVAPNTAPFPAADDGRTGEPRKIHPIKDAYAAADRKRRRQCPNRSGQLTASASSMERLAVAPPRSGEQHDAK